MYPSLRFLPLAILASVLAVACSNDDDAASPITPAPVGDGGGTTPPRTDGGTRPPAGTQDIVDTAVGDGNFNLLAAALTRANLVAALKGAGPFTVLAPTDNAFKKAGFADAAAVNAIPVATLTKILQYHVISGRAPSTAVAGLTSADTLAEGVAPAKLKIRIAASGGVIKIFPTKDLSAGAGTTGPDTGATVATADVQATNGIIHAIDTVLAPPSRDIVGAAQAYPALSSLVAALLANPGGDTPTLVATLQGAGPDAKLFSVFAPTNEAFAALGAGAPTGSALRNVLLYHVAPGFLTSGDVVKAVTANTMVPTASTGKTLSFVAGPKVKDSTTTNANLAIVDVVTTNGIVHVVDKVLIP